jgi:glycerophosphoryl diester phosphodiesterase
MLAGMSLTGRRPPPRPPRYPFLEDPPLAFCHRGLALEATAGLENSMAAFQRAVDLGIRYLETDVHATRDGAVVAIHDRTVDRVTDQVGRIADLSYSALSSARIGGREPVPLLTDLFEAWPDVRFNLDIKEGWAVEPLIDVLRRTGVIDRVCIASFSDRRIAAARRSLGPRLCTSLGPIGIARLRAVATGRLPPHLAPTYAGCAQIPQRAGPLQILTPALLRTAHRLGLQVHVWTVNDAPTMHRLLDQGVDGLMTDRPDTLRDVMTARGVWPT